MHSFGPHASSRETVPIEAEGIRYNLGVSDGNVPTAEYASTVDECVDSTLRAFRRTATHRRIRLKSRVWFGASLAVTTLLVIGQEGGWSPFAIEIAIAVAVVAGLIAALLYGPVHDHLHTRNVRRFFLERFKGAPTMSCRLELRSDAIWMHSTDIDVSVPWRRVTDVVETSAGVELWLEPMALCLVPSRAFARTSDQRTFLDAAKERASSARSRDSA